jgi:uncharacterized membrane protein YkvI
MFKHIRLSLQVGAVYIGTVVGAGFASGQEIMQFFTCFGKAGIITLILSGLLFYIIAASVMDVAVKYNVYNYKDFIGLIAGKKLGFAYDALITVFLVIVASIMFSGSGALFEESLGLPGIWGIVLMAALTLVIILQDMTGLLRINSVIVPFLFAVILSVLGATIVTGDFAGIGVKLSENYRGSFVKPLVYMVFYCCYNTFLSVGVLAAIPQSIRSRKILKAGVFFGALGLMLLSLMLNISLTLKSPQVLRYSIPMHYITSGFGTIVGYAVSFCIWCEIFSTAVSDVFSVAKRLSAGKPAHFASAGALTVLLCLPLSFFEFKGLISFFYPLFGALSILMVVRLLYFSYRKNPFHLSSEKVYNIIGGKMYNR